MKTKIITFITLACAVIILYAAPPKTMSTCGDNLYIALDWNKPTPDLSEALFKKLIKAQTDSTYLFLSFYEDGLIDQYGNRFIFMSDTIKVRTFSTSDVRRYRNHKYFKNMFNISDSVVEFRNIFTRGVNIDQIDSIARLEVDNIHLTEEELRTIINSLRLQYNAFYDINPFDPLDKSHLSTDTIEIASFKNSLYYLTQIKKMLFEQLYYEEILFLKYPSSDLAPPLIEEEDDE